MNIERKILLLVLGVGVLWAFLLGGLSYSGITQVQRSTEGKGDEMLAAFAAFTENYAESLVNERLAEQAKLTAFQVAGDLGGFYDAENIAKMAEKILEYPQNYSPRYLPEATERTINANKAYIYYNPGVREQLATNPDLAKKIALLSNVADSLEYLSYFYNGDVCFMASEYGCLIRADAVSKGQTTLTLDEATILRSYDFRERPWYVAAKQANGLVLTDVYESMAGGLEIGSVMPFYDHGEFAGVVGISITLKSLHLTANENDISFILNNDGQIVISSRKEGVLSVSGSFVDLRESSQEDLAAVARDMAEGKNGTATVTVDGREYYLAYLPIPYMKGYSCAALTDKEAALAPAMIARATVKKISEEFSTSVNSIFRERIFYIGILFGVIFIVLLLISGGMAHKLVKPVLILTDGVKKIAAGNLDTRLSVKTGDEIEALSDSINAMASDLQSYIKKAKEKERIEGELEGARQIQAGMLPNNFLEFNNQKEIDLYATMTPAKEVGGDFYDFYMLDEKHLAITIADVSGKGVPAALFMMRSRTILKNIAMMSASLDNYAAVISLANKQLCEDNEEAMFVTVFFGVLDLTTGEFAYVNGGHNPPLVCRNGKFDYLPTEKQNTVLGLFDSETYQECCLTFAPGDMIFLYTDGVTEAMNEARELYSEARLQRTLNEQSGKNIKDILTAVRENVSIYAGNAEQSDDITMLGLKFNGKFGGT
ncbi:MAG: SpoIIE family protein phosphatase [Selenomonadaceae bacterium]|nr:SpoIIE family protein phosphatase [Selenomonadaceae bacterium]